MNLGPVTRLSYHTAGTENREAQNLQSNTPIVGLGGHIMLKGRFINFETMFQHCVPAGSLLSEDPRKKSCIERNDYSR